MLLEVRLQLEVSGMRTTNMSTISASAYSDCPTPEKWTHLEDKLLCTIEDKEKLTNRFNENRLVTGGFTHDYSLICGTSYTAQMSAGR